MRGVNLVNSDLPNAGELDALIERPSARGATR